MNGLKSINIELTSRCNKSCHMCGRRKLEREHPELCDWGDMPFEMLVEIAEQIPKGVMVQLHWNGEPLLYPKLDAAMNILRNHKPKHLERPGQRLHFVRNQCTAPTQTNDPRPISLQRKV